MKKKIALMLAVIMLFAAAVPMNLFAGSQTEFSANATQLPGATIIPEAAMNPKVGPSPSVAPNVNAGTKVDADYVASGWDLKTLIKGSVLNRAEGSFRIELTNAKWLFLNDRTAAAPSSGSYGVSIPLADGTYSQSTFQLGDWYEELGTVGKETLSNSVTDKYYQLKHNSDGADDVTYELIVDYGDSTKATVNYTLPATGTDSDFMITIPLVVKTSKDADVDVAITNTNQSNVTAWKGKLSDYSGGTTKTTALDIVTSRDRFELERIRIEEKRIAVVNTGGWFSLKAPAGYYFTQAVSETDGKITDVKVRTDREMLTDTEVYYKYIKDRDSDDYRATLYFYLEDYEQGKDQVKMIYIDGLVLRTRDYDDETYGDVNLKIANISGAKLKRVGADGAEVEIGAGPIEANVTEESFLVAKRVNYDLILTALEDPTKEYSGFKNVDTAAVELKETIAKAWTSAGVTDLILTDAEGNELEEVKPSYIEFYQVEAMDVALTEDLMGSKSEDELKDYDDAREYYYKSTTTSSTYRGESSNGRYDVGTDGELRLMDSGVQFRDFTKGDDPATMRFMVAISAQAGFVGDVYLKLQPQTRSGSATTTYDYAPVKIASLTRPVEVVTKTTDTQIGFGTIPVADVTLIEAAPGALAKYDSEDGNYLELWIESPQSRDSSPVFNKLSNTSTTVTGGTDSQKLKLEMQSRLPIYKITRESTTEPSTIAITSLAISINRSVPYDNYDLIVGGLDVCDNWYGYEIVNDVVQKLDADEFDVPGIVFEKYVSVVTPGENVALTKRVQIFMDSDAVNVDYVDSTLDIPTQVVNDRLFVPLRNVATMLGLADDNVKWDGVNRTVTIICDNPARTVQFKIDSGEYMINSSTLTMSEADGTIIAPYIDPATERTMIPFRALADAFSIPVIWNATTSSAIYNPVTADYVDAGLTPPAAR